MNEIEQAKEWCNEAMLSFPHFNDSAHIDLYDCLSHIYETLDDLTRPRIDARQTSGFVEAAKWQMYLMHSNGVRGKVGSREELLNRLRTPEHEMFLRGYEEGLTERKEEDFQRRAEELCEWENYLFMESADCAT